MAFNNAYIDAFFTEKLDDKYTRLSADQTDLGEPLLRLIDAEDAEECSCWAVESDIFQNIWNYCLLTPGALALVRQKEEEMAMEGGEEMEEDLDDYTEVEAQEDEIEVSEKKKGKRPVAQLSRPPIPAPAPQPNPTPAPTGRTPSFSTPSLPPSSLSASSLSAPAPTPATTIDLNALTRPYTGTAPISANLLNMSQRINSQTSFSRRWLHRNFPAQFVQRGFFADRSDFWDFWMDTRLFDGPMWWHLATGNDKPYPKDHNATAPIQPGSEQPALNRTVGWSDGRIYSAPAPANSTALASTASASASTASASTGTRAAKQQRRN